MSKKVILVVMAFLTTFSIFSEEPTLSIAFLNKNQFQFFNAMAKGSITFSGSEYTFQYSTGGRYWLITGSITIKDNKILFNPSKCLDCQDCPPVDCALTFGKSEGILRKSSDDLYFEYYLDCTSYNDIFVMRPGNKTLSFPIISYPALPNKKVQIGNISALTVGNKKAITTDNLNIREFPSVQSKKIEYSFSPTDDTLAFIPTNTELNVLARTEDKTTINGLTAYWYYILAGGTKGWVFGFYLKISE